jgi:hypothetical protein
MQIGLIQFVAGGLAVWRITHLLHAEDGPWNVLGNLRRLAGQSEVGRMMDCFYCLSIWTALPFAAALGKGWQASALLWPALSGAAVLLERATARPAAAHWYVEKEGEQT